MTRNKRRNRPTAAKEPNRRNDTESYQLENSVIQLEEARVGPVARIKRPGDSAEWAGPLDETTVIALREVAMNER